MLNTPIGLIFSLLLYNQNIEKSVTATLWFFYTIYCILSLIAGIPLLVRRLHDIGKSGSWSFISLIPILGPVVLLFMCAEDSVGDNEWGLSYYGPTVIKKDGFEESTDSYQKAVKTASHKWRCDCGKMIFTVPCPYCGRNEDNIVKQNKQIKIEDGFKKCSGCGAIIPSYVNECVCGCKFFQDHI